MVEYGAVDLLGTFRYHIFGMMPYIFKIAHFRFYAADTHCIHGSLSKKMEQSLSLMIFSQARCPRFASSFYNIIISPALQEPHGFHVYEYVIQKKKCKIFIVSPGLGK